MSLDTSKQFHVWGWGREGLTLLATCANGANATLYCKQRGGFYVVNTEGGERSYVAPAFEKFMRAETTAFVKEIQTLRARVHELKWKGHGEEGRAAFLRALAEG